MSSCFETTTTSSSSPSAVRKSQSCINLEHEELLQHSTTQAETTMLSSSFEVSNLYLNKEERLILPRKGSMSNLDEYLKSNVPKVVSRANELSKVTPDCTSRLSSLDTLCSSSSSSSSQQQQVRCLNVLQGEVAHASANQADVVVSAEATTCHVVALRSTKPKSSKSKPSSDSSKTTVPLVSLAHVDQVYDACIENIVKEHIEHHLQKARDEMDDEMFGFFMDDDDSDEGRDDSGDQQHQQQQENISSYLPNMLQEYDASRTTKSTSMPNLLHDPEERIEMELHMVGGYLDKEGTSQTLSTALIEQFNDLAKKYQDKIKISLSTAAISSLNTESEEQEGGGGDSPQQKHKPVSRGLGIDTRTGEVFPVRKSLPSHLEGPAMEVRSARAFSSTALDSLSVIHDKMSVDGEIRIEPFQYKQQEELNVLLNVTDDVLLSVASTSPEVEEPEQFCTNLRRTISFVNSVPSESVFENNQPLVYTRSSNDLNYWEEKQRYRQRQQVATTVPLY